MASVMNDAINDHFGLVTQAPAWIVWVKNHGQWHGVAGAETRQAAERLLADRLGLVLPRGEQPAADAVPIPMNGHRDQWRHPRR